MRTRTRDKEYPSAVLTDTEIGASRALTPEGFLLCRNVPIARAGWMIYGPGEVPVSPGVDGLVRIYRGTEDLFRPETLASFNGKPIVNEHPPADVDPKTWKLVTVGVVLNPRAGEGEMADCIVVDFLITDAAAIEVINRPAGQNKREVSAGYEADYEEVSPGEGRQGNIIGNHVALVTKGRCGPRCAISDHATTKEPVMVQRVKVVDHRRPRVGVAQQAAIRQAFKDAEEAALSAMGLGSDAGTDQVDDPDDGGDGGDTHIHIHAGAGGGDTPAPAAGGGVDTQDEPGSGGGDLETRVAALEQGIGQILQLLQGGGEGGGATPPAAKTDDDMDGANTEGGPPKDDADPTKGKPTGDSAALATAYQEVMSLAEILVPGFKSPTFDAATPRAKTVDTMCALRRRALDAAAATEDGAALLAAVAGTDTLDTAKMDCAQVAGLFKSAAGAKKLLNHRASTGDGKAPVVTKPAPTTTKDGLPLVRTIADLNAMHEQYYARQRAH